MQVTCANNMQNSYGCSSCQSQPQPTVCVPQPSVQTQYNQVPSQAQAVPAQTVQVPSSSSGSGVHIQIFNPSIATPGAPAPTYNVNSPSYYPPNYYTGQIGQQGKDGCACCNGGNTTAGDGVKKEDSSVNSGDVNAKSDSATASTSTETLNKKTETKNIVELTDQYIMNLENYLNSQEKDIRLGAAKEVFARLEEDPSRKDDKALTALINKMLQDPSEEIRMFALAALDGRYCLGDDFTVKLLQNMQSKPDGYGQDAIDAAEILLKMSAKQVKKEVEVDPARQKTVKTETKTETKKASK